MVFFDRVEHTLRVYPHVFEERSHAAHTLVEMVPFFQWAGDSLDTCVRWNERNEVLSEYLQHFLILLMMSMLHLLR